MQDADAINNSAGSAYGNNHVRASSATRFGWPEDLVGQKAMDSLAMGHDRNHTLYQPS
jgi:hypothetical protein